MNYKESWEELKNKLVTSSKTINKVSEMYYTNSPEYRRLIGKLEGIELTIGYMRDIEKVMLDD